MRKYIAIGAAVCSIFLCVIMDRRGQANHLAGLAQLRIQTNDLVSLRAEFNRLAAPTNRVAAGTTNDRARELAELRAKADGFMKQTNELGVLLAKKRASDKASAAANPIATLPDDAKVKIALSQQSMGFSMAFLIYTDEHSNQAPPDMESLRPYFKRFPEGTTPDPDSTEVIFHGSLDRLDGIHRGTVAVVRSRQAWRLEDGRLGRVYGFLDGHSQQIATDDNFQSYEALHVMPDAPGGQ